MVMGSLPMDSGAGTVEGTRSTLSSTIDRGHYQLSQIEPARVQVQQKPL